MMGPKQATLFANATTEPQRSWSIHNAFVSDLGRLPDWDGFMSLYCSSLSVDEIGAEIKRSEEASRVEAAVESVSERLRTSGRKRNVLLFGAFGNGNFGDSVMPSLIGPNLESRFDVAVFANSALSFGSFDYPPHKNIPTPAGVTYGMLNRRLVELFDAVLIGAGGLIAYRHDPLWNSEWPYLMSRPYALLGCGVSSPVPEVLHNLIRQAAHATARDAQGVASLQSVLGQRATARLCPDPVLALLQPQTMSPSVDGVRAYILRGPLTEQHLRIRESISCRDIVIGFEPGVDWPLIDLFREMRFVHTVEQVVASIAQAELVISERFHGAVIALSAGKPCFGLTRGDHNEAKIVSLLRSCGGGDWHNQSVTLPDTTFPFAAASAFFEQQRAAYRIATDHLMKSLCPDMSSDASG